MLALASETGSTPSLRGKCLAAHLLDVSEAIDNWESSRRAEVYEENQLSVWAPPTPGDDANGSDRADLRRSRPRARSANEAKKRQGGRSALPKACLEVLAIGQFRKETVAGPPSGHGKLLKPLSRLASLRIVVLSQEASAALTSAMICAVVSG